MKKLIFYTLSSVVVMTVTLISCNEKQEVVDAVAKHTNQKSADVFSRITVKNSRVHFLNENDFKSYFEAAALQSEKTTEDFFSALAFNSLKEKNQASELVNSSPEVGDPLPSTEEEGAEGETSLVEDEFMYFLLNEQAEFSMDNLVFKITPEFTYAQVGNTAINYDDALLNLTRQTYNSKPTDVFFEVKPGLSAFKIEKNETGQKFFGCAQTASNESQYATNPHRKLKAKIWSQNIGVYASAGCSTKHLRRRLRVWWQTRTDFIEVA